MDTLHVPISQRPSRTGPVPALDGPRARKLHGTSAPLAGMDTQTDPTAGGDRASADVEPQERAHQTDPARHRAQAPARAARRDAALPAARAGGRGRLPGAGQVPRARDTRTRM